MAATTQAAEPARTRPPALPEPRGGGLSGAVAAEWTKLWGLNSTWICLLVALLATAGIALLGAVGLDSQEPPPQMVPAHTLAPTATLLPQFAVTALAALMVTGEYATGAIRTTLTTVPMRLRMLSAKLAVQAVVTFAVGCASGAATVGVTFAVFGDRLEFQTAHVLHAVVGTGGYMLGISLMTLGLGLMLRSTAGAITAAIGVLMVIPTINTMIGDETVSKITSYLPADAGVELMMGAGDPYGWGTGALLLAGWAALSLAAGYVVLRRRDA